MTLTINHASVPTASIVITTNGSSPWDLVSFNPGRGNVENKFAASDYAPGGPLIHSHEDIITMDLVIRVTGTSLANLAARIAAYAALLNQRTWTLTDALYTSTTYTCYRAVANRAYDPHEAANLADFVAATIQRQP